MLPGGSGRPNPSCSSPHRWEEARRTRRPRESAFSLPGGFPIVVVMVVCSSEVTCRLSKPEPVLVVNP